MKKQPIHILLCMTFVFLAFTLGFFLGRNQNHHSIHLSVVPVEARHDSPPVTSPSTESAEPTVSFPIDINSADLDSLTALPGIGETLARRILDYRSTHGSFSRPEELMNVEGIGTAKLEAILDYIVTGG